MSPRHRSQDQPGQGSWPSAGGSGLRREVQWWRDHHQRLLRDRHDPDVRDTRHHPGHCAPGRVNTHGSASWLAAKSARSDTWPPRSFTTYDLFLSANSTRGPREPRLSIPRPKPATQGRSRARVAHAVTGDPRRSDPRSGAANPVRIRHGSCAGAPRCPRPEPQGPRPFLPPAMRHDTGLAQPWASRGVERGRGNAQGEGVREVPLAGHCTGGSYLRLATDGGPFCVR